MKMNIQEDLDDLELTDSQISKKRHFNRIKIIIICFTSIFFLSILLTLSQISLDLTFNLVGSLAIPPICFVFPSLIYLDMINKGLIS